MKTTILCALVLTVVLVACASAEAPFRLFTLNLAPGSSPATVQKILGAPSAMLRPDLWVYLDFTTSHPDAANPDFDTLVVAFTDGRVTAVKLTDGRVVRQLLARYKVQTDKTVVGAK